MKSTAGLWYIKYSQQPHNVSHLASLTSCLWQRSHLVHIRFCVGPVHLHHDKMLIGCWGRRGGLIWAGGRKRRRPRRCWYIRGGWRIRRRGLDSRFHLTRRLDPRERSDRVLAHDWELRRWDVYLEGVRRRCVRFGCFWVLGFFGMGTRRGGEVQAWLGRARRGTFTKCGFSTGTVLKPWGRRRFKGRRGIWGGMNLILGWKRRALVMPYFRLYFKGDQYIPYSITQSSQLIMHHIHIHHTHIHIKHTTVTHKSLLWGQEQFLSEQSVHSDQEANQKTKPKKNKTGNEQTKAEQGEQKPDEWGVSAIRK